VTAETIPTGGNEQGALPPVAHHSEIAGANLLLQGVLKNQLFGVYCKK
jgi:hypothetical protein